MLESFTAQTFRPHLGDRFRIAPGATLPVEVELIEVTELDPGVTRAGAPPPRRPFALVFRAAHDPRLPQRIYRVEHATLGPCALFLVPIGPDGQGWRYEAVFA